MKEPERIPLTNNPKNKEPKIKLALLLEFINYI